jgi:steroid 5-alpha reductase family enzyme
MIQHPYVVVLSIILAVGVVSWLFSVIKKDVSFVDSLWSLFFLVAAAVFAIDAQPLSGRGALVLSLVAIWALRLSIYITARNWGQPEDYRYQAIRANNEPGFAFKSLYIVFGLQGVLAWVIALPLFPAITSDSALSMVDVSRFKARADSKGRVLDTGLWRYTRHPNYFGDFCIWWSFYLFAVASGGWWSIISPLLMSLLLMKVSGVAMLEKKISVRRPKYAEYIHHTNTFFPGPRRNLNLHKEIRS